MRTVLKYASKRFSVSSNQSYRYAPAWARNIYANLVAVAVRLL